VDYTSLSFAETESKDSIESTQSTRGAEELNAVFSGLLERSNRILEGILTDDSIQSVLVGPEPVVILAHPSFAQLPFEGSRCGLHCPLFWYLLPSLCLQDCLYLLTNQVLPGISPCTSCTAEQKR
jgi:hypothetical protein